jgi:hypothetical protein
MSPSSDLADLLDALEAHTTTLERYAVEVSKDALLRSEDEQNKVLFGGSSATRRPTRPATPARAGTSRGGLLASTASAMI